MEATTLSVGKSVLNGALRYAQSALAEEVALQLGVRHDQVFITNELEMMQAFLMAAHGEGDDHSRVVKVWVKQVRDVAYNVEDSLQDFAVRLGRQSWWRIHRTLLDRRHVAKQMKELRANVEDVSQRNMRYQLIKDSGSKPATAIAQSAIPRATMSGADEARWQRDEAKVDLIRLINKKGDDLRVIAVSGTSTGHPIETSFVKRVYEDRQIHKKFKCRAWISLMCPFNLTELLRSIIEQFHENFLQEAGQTEVSSEVQFLRKMGMTTDDDLALEFTRYVNEKSYLIVLHDIRTIKEWGRIKMCFPNNKKGSRIIVSAAQIGVASLCVGPVDAAPECKKLFVDQTLYVFYSKDSQEATDLVEAWSSSSVTALESDSSANRQRLIHKEMMLAALKESGLIGRDNEKSHIMKLIANEDSQQREVICLWGMGGLGKTTLIKHVYQSQEFIDKFEKRACVTIMRPFSPPDILNDIAKQFGYKDAEDLVAHLDMKKYLIVLDDLLSNAEWDAIIAFFPRMETASRIVITTRIKDIAKHCSKNSKHENVYELLSLGHKDAYDLFMNKVFGKITKLDEHYPELVEQANLILKKCGGLPLALVTIGGFLASQPKSVVEWRKLNEHISAELETNPELEAIKTILIKSYDGLPYHLKSCFLYMPIFPEDYVVRRRRLVHRWAAEGYSMEVRGKSTEEILDSYFIKLISRGMLLPSQRSVYSRERVDSCQVHDLIREIGISKSMEENLIFRMEEGCSSNRQSTARHLAINGNWIGDQSEYERTVDMSRVRSLTVFGKWRSFFLSDKMVLLRVLDLEDTKGLVDQHLKHIGRLLHLRYLSLRGCEHICHLPDSLGNMSQLETLDIRRTSIEMLPKTITKLQKLQYIHAGKKQRYSSTGRGLSDQCPLLVAGALLCVVCCLPQVCWCDGVTVQSTGVMVPRGIGKLKSLHTLSGVELASGDSVLQEIKGLTGLRKLGVVGMTEKNGLQFCSVISSLSRLESLSIMRSHDLDLIGNRLRLCLRDVASPPGLLPVHMLHGGYLDRLPSNLQSFKLHGAYVDTLPKWFMKLENLVKLELTLKAPSKVEQDGAMQVLGNLPNLSILHLDVKNFRGEVLCFQMEAFRNLGVLHYGIHGSGSGSGNAHQSFNVIRTGDEVQILVKFDLGAMAKLEQLVFDTSSRRGLIEFSGLEFLPSIKEVVAMDVGCEQRLRKHLALHPNKPILKLRMPQCMYH